MRAVNISNTRHTGWPRRMVRKSTNEHTPSSPHAMPWSPTVRCCRCDAARGMKPQKNHPATINVARESERLAEIFEMRASRPDPTATTENRPKKNLRQLINLIPVASAKYEITPMALFIILPTTTTPSFIFIFSFSFSKPPPVIRAFV